MTPVTGRVPTPPTPRARTLARRRFRPPPVPTVARALESGAGWTRYGLELHMREVAHVIGFLRAFTVLDRQLEALAREAALTRPEMLALDALRAAMSDSTAAIPIPQHPESRLP